MSEKTKIQIIREELQNNPNVVVVDTKEEFPGHSIFCIASFYVAPKAGIYTAAALNDFGDSLISLKPSYVQKPIAWEDRLSFGEWSYDEKIGEIKESSERYLDVSDSELIQKLKSEFEQPFPVLQLKGVIHDVQRSVADDKLTRISRHIWNRDAIRRTFVELFPNPLIAKDRRTTPGFSYKEIEKYKQKYEELLAMQKA